MKYHINNNGEVAVCHAQEGNWPLSGKHFNNPNEAQDYADEMNEYVYNSNLDESLARKEYVEIKLYREKLNSNKEYSLKEALNRGLYVEEKVQLALKNKQDTYSLYYDKESKDYKSERKALHNKILKEILKKYENVPSEGKVIFSGGISGAGKTTILNSQLKINFDKYAIVSSDDFKEILARENAIPKIEGLTPMEASTLVHKESSYLADRLLKNLAYKNKNIIYDFTCKDENSALDRIKILNNFNYSNSKIQMVFVDVPLSISKERAKYRYKEGLNNFKGYGGRWVPSHVQNNQKSISNKFNTKNSEVIVKIGTNKNLNLPKPIIFDNTDIPTKIDFNDFKLGYKE